MKKSEFDKLEAALKERGYKKYQQHWKHEDYVLGALFHRDDNHWDEDRPGCQVILSIYDYTMHPEFYDRIRDHVGIEVTVMVSRVIDERMDLTMSWADDTTIEEIECMADSFYRWVLTAYPEPRKVF